MIYFFFLPALFFVTAANRAGKPAERLFFSSSINSLTASSIGVAPSGSNSLRCSSNSSSVALLNVLASPRETVGKGGATLGFNDGFTLGLGGGVGDLGGANLVLGGGVGDLSGGVGTLGGGTSGAPPITTGGAPIATGGGTGAAPIPSV